MLSGFLITGILVDGEGKPKRIRNFLARRVLRIFPLYYLALLLIFFVVPLFTSDPSVIYSASDKPYYALYVQNLFLPLIEPDTASSVYLSHTWSLAIEEQFYLVWPWLVIFLPRRMLIALLCLILVAAPLARFQILSDHPRAWYQYWLVYKNTLLHVDGLAVGSLLALIVRSKHMTKSRVRNAGLVVGLLTLSFAVWTLIRLAKNGVTHYPYTPTEPILGSIMFTILSLGFGGLLAVILALPSRLMDGLLCNAVVTWIGRISYGLYVYHFPIILGLRSYDLHPAVSVAATFGVAAISWYVFESPILKLKARFS